MDCVGGCITDASNYHIFVVELCKEDNDALMKITKYRYFNTLTPEFEELIRQFITSEVYSRVLFSKNIPFSGKK